MNEVVESHIYRVLYGSLLETLGSFTLHFGLKY